MPASTVCIVGGGAQRISSVYFTDLDNDIVVIVFANRDEPIADDLSRMLFRMMRAHGEKGHNIRACFVGPEQA
ncbi:MAG: hypothetical protein JKY60_18965 [Kordiimonadaceae bacterium]|nr:hypothetical protein [Kordiimonadaceae bacterium]